MSDEDKLSYINEQIFTDTIYLDPNDINTPNITKLIIIKLKKKIGNKSHNNGYIIGSSIKYISKTLGKIVTLSNENKILYNIKYKVKMIQPTVNDEIECYVDNMNKMGVIAYIKMRDIIDDYEGANTLQDSPVLIIIPNETIEDVEDINIGKKIQIKVNATRIKFNADKIRIVGTIIN